MTNGASTRIGARGMTPWAMGALAAAGITRADLDDLTPAGWKVGGFGRSSRGPWTFVLMHDDPKVAPLGREVTVHRTELVRDAIAGLLASVTPDLETQLANSLAILEGGRR